MTLDRKRQNMHVITGATGFVGGAILIELLRQTPDDVLVLVRRRPQQSAQDRLRATLSELGHAYRIEPPILAAAAERCHAVEGDVTLEQCGVDARLEGRVAQFWHCAASLRYEDRYEQEIRAANVDGTRNSLALAHRLEAESFNHISTAYVAGRQSGTIAEELFHRVETNNAYERSKLDAEQLVAASRGGLVRILRPSIVIGHSATLEATTFSGFYGFLRQLRQLKGMTDRAQEGLLERTPLHLRADAEVSLNFIPVDSVARQAVCVALADRAGGVFHLTHPAPPSVGLALTTMFRSVGLRDPLFVTSKEQFSWLDQRFDQRLDFYCSYFLGEKRFDRRRTDAILGRPVAELPLDVPQIEAYSRWYLERLARERTQLPVSR